jgi:hypothetical protein
MRIELLIVAAAAAIALAAPQGALAQEDKAPKDKPNQEQTFKGKVEAVDASAKTLTVGATVLYVNDSTKITKDGAAIKLSEIQKGDQVHGKSRLSFDGKAEALTVMVGAAQPDKDKEKRY